MNSVIERYLEVVVSGVTPRERADVARELQDAIENGVRERTDEGLDEDAAVEAVLEDFGDPLQLAARYRSRPLGLISAVAAPRPRSICSTTWRQGPRAPSTWRLESSAGSVTDLRRC
ncbi:permease prefix domain 1-containing protein [Dactylosporangium sp. CA-152071]|uniref:permease prefix domain 1-containing protein n=1 Tax=Dactylosporangium sp. CA-152071 TaxID=3239933 RepID=UPI003D8A6BBF